MKINPITYRWTYILFATILTTVTLYQYAKALPELIPSDNLIKEMLMCSGQILWQGSIILVFIKRKTTLYLTHMITVSLLGSILLLPIILIHSIYPTHLAISITYFLAVVCFMIIEHARRVKK